MELQNNEAELKIYNLLAKLKKENKDRYDYAKRILRYIYKICKEDYFFKKYNHLLIEEDHRNSTKSTNLKIVSKYLIEKYIEDDNQLLDNFIKLCNDPNDLYFNKFKESTEVFIEMAEEGIYSNYGIYKYIFNIYSMLAFYDLKQDDFRSFTHICDQLSNFFISSSPEQGFLQNYSLNDSLSSQVFDKKRNIILKILNQDNFVNLPSMTELLKIVLDEIGCNYENEVYSLIEDVISNLNSLSNQRLLMERDNQTIDEKLFLEIEKDILGCFINTIIDTDYDRRKRRRKHPSNITVYLPILTFGTRYEYTKKKLFEVIESPKFIMDIVQYISKMNEKQFEVWNNQHGKEDSFIVCINSVFESDSLHEVISKLNYLIDVTNSEEKMLFSEVIFNLSSDAHKAKIGDQIIEWPKTNSINQIEKPKKIIDRMIILHENIEYAPTEEFYKKSSVYYRDIKDFVSAMNNEFEKNKQRELAKLKAEKELLSKQEEQDATQSSQKKKKLGSFLNFNKSNN